MTNSLQLHCKMDDLLLNESAAVLERGGDKIELAALTYALLLVLLKQAPAVVTSRQLVELVWKGKVVSEETIQQRVTLLRKALGDDHRNPKYIATVRGQGYQWITSIESLTPNKSAIETSIANNSNLYQKQRRRKLFLATIMSLSLLIVLVLLSSPKPTKLSPNPQSTETAEDFEPSKHSTNATARSYYFNGRDYLNLKNDNDNKAAIVQFQKAIELDPNYALAYTGLAHSYAEKYLAKDKDVKWQDLALSAAQKAVELSPDIAETHYALGVVYQVSGERDLAYNSYKNVLNYHSYHYTALNNVSVIARKKKLLNDALHYSFVMVKSSPRHFLGYLQVAEAFLQLGMLEHAYAWFEKAQSFAPQHRYIQYSLCQIQIAQGQYEGRDHHCQKMVDWQPDDGWGYELIGELELLKGNQEQGIKWYKKAMELDSNYAKFRYASLIKLEGKLELAEPLLKESLESMLRYYDKNKGDDSGAILNLIDYHGATGDEQGLYFWFEQLLKTNYSEQHYFLNNSNLLGFYQQERFRLIMKELLERQDALKKNLPHQWLIYPKDIDDIKQLQSASD